MGPVGLAAVMAAEACAFLATLCVRAMAEFDPQAESARAFLIRVADEYSATELAPPAATRTITAPSTCPA